MFFNNHQQIPLILFFIIKILVPSGALICYSCTTTLNPNIEENAKMALRVFLNSVYELPPGI